MINKLNKFINMLLDMNNKYSINLNKLMTKFSVCYDEKNLKT